MTMITRWDPFRDMASLQNRLNQIFADYGRGTDELSTAGFVPPVDIYEDEQSLSLKLEVPGIAEKDLDVRVENNTLTVRGERKFEQEEKEENFHRIERRYGSFSRSFTLPNTVDPEQVNAEFENGMALLGFGMSGTASTGGTVTFERGRPLQVTLFLAATRLVDKAYTIFVHLVDQDGIVRAQSDRPPLNGLYPTDRWPIGTPVQDTFTISIPPDLTVGEYTLRVGVYAEAPVRIVGGGQDVQLDARVNLK